MVRNVSKISKVAIKFRNTKLEENIWKSVIFGDMAIVIKPAGNEQCGKNLLNGVIAIV